MKFYKAANIREATQTTLDTLNKLEAYFDRGNFATLYPKEKKKCIDHIRKENYFYKRKDGNYYALLIVLKSGIYDEDKDNILKIIKSLEVIRDNKAIVQRNGIIIKILIKEQNIEKEQTKNANY